MSKPTTYDFTETAVFLDNSMDLNTLNKILKQASEIITSPTLLSNKFKRGEVLGALIVCSDLLNTITLK